jgi:hypothetical protein
MTAISQSPSVQIVETVVSNIRFDVDSALVESGYPPEHWKSTSGTVSWHVQMTGECSGVGQGNFAIPNLQDDHIASLHIWKDNGKQYYSAGSGPWPGNVRTYQVHCPGKPPATMQFMTMIAMGSGPGLVADTLASDGESFGNNYVDRTLAPTHVTHVSYSFRCARGC